VALASSAFDEMALMDESHFKKMGLLSSEDVPYAPGLYCIRLKKGAKLPEPFGSTLAKRGHNILYIGIATASLNHRFWGQELHAKGHGTFFRSMGAVLGYRPEKGLLIEKKNQRNYTFRMIKNRKS
jgi:hypothetical protein